MKQDLKRLMEMDLPSNLWRVLSALLVLVLALSACVGEAGQGKPWTMTALSGERLDSLNGARLEVLVSEGRKPYRLEFFLLHDNRTEQEAIPLRMMLCGKQDTVYQGEMLLPLARERGRWIGQGLLQHEVEFALPAPIRIKYPGIYTLHLYSPLEPSPRGISLLAFRLIQVSN